MKKKITFNSMAKSYKIIQEASNLLTFQVIKTYTFWLILPINLSIKNVVTLF